MLYSKLDGIIKEKQFTDCILKNAIDKMYQHDVPHSEIIWYECTKNRIQKEILDMQIREEVNKLWNSKNTSK